MVNKSMYEPGPEMFTEEGNNAVRRAIVRIKAMVEDDLSIRNRVSLDKAAAPILRAVASQHAELWDTEPRNWVSDQLDRICDMYGWKYNEYETYGHWYVD